MKIYTSYYSNKQLKTLNPDEYEICSISVGFPRWKLGYDVSHVRILKPYGIFGKYDNMVDNEREYRKYLNAKNVAEINNELLKASRGKPNIVLLCYEKDVNDCHRGVFARWWEETTGEKVEELNLERKSDVKVVHKKDRHEDFSLFLFDY